MQGRRARRKCERVSWRSWRILLEVEARTPRDFPGAFCFGTYRYSDTSVRERIRADLHLVDLGAVLRAALVVEHRPRSRHDPQALAFPARVRAVDAAVDHLGLEAH